jgi:phage shock protein B
MGELFMVFAFILAITALSGGILIGIIKTLKGSSGKRGSEQQSEQARIIQELYQSLRSMEKRVDSLETILLDKHRKDGSQ